MSEESLDQLLDESYEVPEAEEPEAVEEEVVDKPEDKAEEPESDETGVEKDGSPPEPNDDFATDKERAFYAKSQDYKRKYQEAEEELKQLRAASQKPEEKSPDPLDDPEGFSQSIDSKIAESEFRTRVTTSQALMRMQHEDYDDKESRFLELAKDDPVLIQQMRNSAVPAKFVVDTVVKHEKLEKFDSFDDAVKDAVSKQVADIEASIREKLEKEYKDKLGLAGSLPPSGAGGSQGSDNTSVAFETLDDILGNQ